jgi:hypothetical protein
MDQKPSKSTLLWVRSHVRIPGSEEANEAAQETREEVIQHYKKNPPQDPIKWIKNKHQEEQQEKLERSTFTM